MPRSVSARSASAARSMSVGGGSVSPGGRSRGSRRWRGPTSLSRNGIVSGVGAGAVAADEAPQDGGRVGVHHRGEVEQHAERDRAAGVVGQPAGVDVPGRVGRPFRLRLRRQAGAALARYSSTARGITSKYSRLARCGALYMNCAEAFLRGVAQPFLDRQAVALRLADLLRLLVEEQLVGEALGRRAAEDAADAAGQPDAVDQVLARHLVVDAERVPAHRPVGLPLQLAGAALHRGFERLAGVGIAPDDGAGGGVALLPSAPA